MVLQVGAFLFDPERGGSTAKLTSLTTAAAQDIFGRYDLVASVELGGLPHLLMYERRSGAAQFYVAGLTAPFFTLAGNENLGVGWDAIESFVLANQPYVMCYQRENGRFEFRAIDQKLTLSDALEFHRSHEPGPTAGFTMIRPFVSMNQVAFMGYNSATGAVAMYTVAATVAAPPTKPPLQPLCVWSHTWAKNWTRFVFFAMGGANFFLKTNTGGTGNVNIDRIMDGLAAGTLEVSAHMELHEALDQTLNAALILDDGSPYFVNCKADGSGVIYRIHTDCQGWDKILDVEGPNMPEHLLTLRFGTRHLVLFC
ncbi:hypothetical protein SAMN03159463_02346 [Mesorhizobium sp. NFR06]|uniref:hypothetical protein n=1 Tax=Mesorhizobium sp. NFR06 TaxID=1566290 RepID=UPI0008F245D1|nr:hypothetical protein [Mesorhizobium sp. NFR06]SFO58124.1 hypothetical protein SAMN03159463_02346 [Mesorhizobium sp. NFR06]